jgi:hypothetical protein
VSKIDLLDSETERPDRQLRSPAAGKRFSDASRSREVQCSLGERFVARANRDQAMRSRKISNHAVAMLRTHVRIDVSNAKVIEVPKWSYHNAIEDCNDKVDVNINT